ncbi:MAG: hypothetical protein CM1200mP10_30090 [Candidatus Neomarinimicrobiota bacterium]|nr:MAG: hypothetical protein CM1200mP10_30090 [Candidatus Neomarinimicrobiota bacterium]
MWEISTMTSPNLLWKKSLSELGINKEITQVSFASSIKQLFALESKSVPYISIYLVGYASVWGNSLAKKPKNFEWLQIALIRSQCMQLIMTMD